MAMSLEQVSILGNRLVTKQKTAVFMSIPDDYVFSLDDDSDLL